VPLAPEDVGVLHHGRSGPLLNDHRRSALYAGLLLAALAFMLVGVGRHPTNAAPVTTFAPIGRFDASLYNAIVPDRRSWTTDVAKVFDLAGQGIVTIPLRIALLAVLLWRRRWPAAIAFAVTWALSEIVVDVLKPWYARGRPPQPLVATGGFSFPSGHATAGAAITVAIVLAFVTPGRTRRGWVAIAIVFAFVMAFSRVYLGAHWFSDVAAGVLLGSATALGSFSAVQSIRHRRLVVPIDDQPPEGTAAPLDDS
jgi:membrane-associated phospholipid phosphatase